MNSKTLIILEAARGPESGKEDRLQFSTGVNVIVGPPNTGKSKWLRMIDFLLGSKNNAAESFGEDLAEKYETVSAAVRIGDSEFVLERRWKQPGATTKIFVNDEAYTLVEFYEFLMSELEIPIVHFPQGNPYGPRSWPELSWRSLLRHLYRRQHFWSDLADNQPDSEQHAALLQFLGLGTKLFSSDYQELVANQKRIVQLQTTKDQFVDMLQRVSQEILTEKEVGVAITPQSIAQALDRILLEISELEDKRAALIGKSIEKATNPKNGNEVGSTSVIEELSRKLAQLNIDRERTVNEITDSETRLDELRSYRKSVIDERGRMGRAVEAGDIIADLKVTNCPVCDQEIISRENNIDCYLCHRPMPRADNNLVGRQRLEFELEQLEGEILETDELISHLSDNWDSLKRRLDEIDSQVRLTQDSLRPTRVAVSSILPPDLHLIDLEIGRLQERREQLLRIQRTLHQRENLSDEIQQIEDALIDLEQKVLEQSRGIEFERLGDRMGDVMNDYLNQISESAETSWTQGKVSFRINEKRSDVRVGGEPWRAKLGGSLTNIFLLAYHYSLLSLTKFSECNYPGLLLLDFPAEIEESTSVGDKENFVLEPFVNLMAQDGMHETQLIAAGSSFENLAGSTRIEFSRIWR